mgnify:CR=1 FL=1
MTTSIIIPVYNVEAYLPKCLDSILVDNNYKEEVICVNDGSTDGSRTILEEYASKFANIRIITQLNKGLSVARNTGLRAAQGDYVFFIDSDDWVAPNTLQKVIEKIDGEDVVYFNSKVYSEAICQIGSCYDIEEWKHMDGQAYFAVACAEQRNMPCVCVWGGVYNRRFLIDNDLWNEPGIYHEDNYFTPQVLLKAHNVSCVNDFLYIYRVRTNGNITAATKPKHIKDLLFITRHLYKLFKDVKNINPSFFYYISGLHTDLICRSYDNHLPLWKWWRLNDSIHYYKSQNNSRQRKAAVLSMIMPRLSYKYLTDNLPSLLRRFINRFM